MVSWVRGHEICKLCIKSIIMKFKHSFPVTALVLVIAGLLLSFSAFTQKSSTDIRIIADSKKAKSAFIRGDGLMKGLFEKAHGYVIFPNVGKGGLGVGGASGNGTVYENGVIIGSARLTQVTIGLQAGGQAYREVIFFESDRAMEEFKENKLEFSAQMSAVAIKPGAAANAKFDHGVMIFSQTKGGLMYEASIGGQKFRFKKF